MSCLPSRSVEIRPASASSLTWCEIVGAPIGRSPRSLTRKQSWTRPLDGSIRLSSSRFRNSLSRCGLPSALSSFARRATSGSDTRTQCDVFRTVSTPDRRLGQPWRVHLADHRGPSIGWNRGPRAGVDRSVSRPTVVTAVLAALAAPAPAVAEDVEPPEAVPTKLAVRLDGDRAALQLTVHLALRGPEVHALSVDVPFHGSLVGATVRERGRTRALDLVEATRAGERFAAIQAGPAGAGRAAAILLSDEDLGRIEVAAAVPRRTTLALELDYTAPTCFLRDHRHVRIPAAWAAVLDAAGRRRVVPAEAAAEPDGVAARCAPTSWGHDDRGAVWLALPTDELAARPP